jgi:ankyrin repeat protein
MQVMTRLVEMGVDVNHELTRKRPYTNGRQRFTDYDMRDGVAPLFLAVLGGDQESLDFLLQHGAEVELPNVFQMTPLMIAAGMRGSGRNEICGGAGDAPRNLRMMDSLIAAGADINRQITGSRNKTGTLMAYVAGCDQEGRTALMSAAIVGSDTTVKELLQRGANPLLRDAEGLTALDHAKAPAPKTYPEGAQRERLLKGRAAAAELLEAAMARAAPVAAATPGR